MITATFLAIFFIPLFFVGVVQLFEKKKGGRTERPGPDAESPSEER
jgi:HAE1 family hydrophobic/amphiphilic exporter-1